MFVFFFQSKPLCWCDAIWWSAERFGCFSVTVQTLRQSGSIVEWFVKFVLIFEHFNLKSIAQLFILNTPPRNSLYPFRINICIRVLCHLHHMPNRYALTQFPLIFVLHHFGKKPQLTRVWLTGKPVRWTPPPSTSALPFRASNAHKLIVLFPEKAAVFWLIFAWSSSACALKLTFFEYDSKF